VKNLACRVLVLALGVSQGACATATRLSMPPPPPLKRIAVLYQEGQAKAQAVGVMGGCKQAALERGIDAIDLTPEPLTFAPRLNSYYAGLAESYKLDGFIVTSLTWIPDYSTVSGGSAWLVAADGRIVAQAILTPTSAGEPASYGKRLCAALWNP
jgi:hypothetical protein